MYLSWQRLCRPFFGKAMHALVAVLRQCARNRVGVSVWMHGSGFPCSSNAPIAFFMYLLLQMQPVQDNICINAHGCISVSLLLTLNSCPRSQEQPQESGSPREAQFLAFDLCGRCDREVHAFVCTGPVRLQREGRARLGRRSTRCAPVIHVDERRPYTERLYVINAPGDQGSPRIGATRDRL